MALAQYQNAGGGFLNELKNIFITFWAAKEVIDGNMTLGMMLATQQILGQSDQNNSLVQKLCNTSKKTSCQTVLDSKASKLFGWLSLSELGLVYFAGGFFVLLISSFSVVSIQIPTFLAWLSALALPYTLFSVYYQKFVVKQWCPLCLGVLVVCVVLILLWLDFALGFQFLNLPPFPTLNVLNLQLLILCFAIPTAFWMLAKPWWQESQQLNPTKQELNSFKMDGEWMEKFSGACWRKADL